MALQIPRPLTIVLANNGQTSDGIVEGQVIINKTIPKHQIAEVRLELTGESLSAVFAKVEDEVYIRALDSATLCFLQQKLWHSPTKDSSNTLPFRFEIPEYPRPERASDWEVGVPGRSVFGEDEASAKHAHLFQTRSEHRMPPTLDMQKPLLWRGKRGGQVQYTITATLDVDAYGDGDNGGTSAEYEEPPKATKTVIYLPFCAPSDVTQEMDLNTTEIADFSGAWLLPKEKRPRGLFAVMSPKKVQPRARFSVGIACPKQLVLATPYVCPLFFENVELSPQMEGTMPSYEISHARFKLIMKQCARSRGGSYNPTIEALMTTEVRSKDVFKVRNGEGLVIEKDGENLKLVMPYMLVPVDCTVSTVNVARHYFWEMALEVRFNEHKTVKLKKTMPVEILARMEYKDGGNVPPRYSFIGN